MKIQQLQFDPNNANRGTERGRKALTESLKQYGAGRSILVDKKGRVIAGNKTLEQAIAAGHKDVLVVKTDGTKLVAVQRMDLDLKDKRAKALAIADNRVSELDLEWDEAVLAELGKEIDLSAFWSSGELEKLLGIPAGEAPEPQIDKSDELQKKWKTKVGQIWAIGEHRLLCGDSTNKQDVAHLASKECASLLFTSPPYGAQRDYGSKADASQWDALMSGVFSAAPVDQKTQILVNLGIVHESGEWVPYWQNFIQFMQSAGWRRFGWYVWDQGPGLPGDWNGRLAPSHEFIFHFNKEARRANKTIDCKWAGESNHGRGLRKKDGTVGEYTHVGRDVQDKKIPDSVFRVVRHKARGVEVQHPAVFSVDLAKEVIEAYTQESDLIYEPFAGSGSQICAAQLTKRRCYAIEIEPKYVAVALERLEAMGLKPKLA